MWAYQVNHLQVHLTLELKPRILVLVLPSPPTPSLQIPVRNKKNPTKLAQSFCKWLVHELNTSRKKKKQCIFPCFTIWKLYIAFYKSSTCLQIEGRHKCSSRAFDTCCTGVKSIQWCQPLSLLSSPNRTFQSLGKKMPELDIQTVESRVKEAQRQPLSLLLNVHRQEAGLLSQTGLCSHLPKKSFHRTT